MHERLKMTSFVVLLLTVSTPAFATGELPHVERSQHDTRQRNLDFDFDFTSDYRYAPDINWLDQVTMRRLPPGSLTVRYDGVQKVLVKYARSQIRRLERQYRVPDDKPSRLEQDLMENSNPITEWWSRSWMDSMPASKGGAPGRAYVHTVGKEIDWRFGPITISNTLKFRIDYLAVFKFNADPTPAPGLSKPQRLSVDVYPTDEKPKKRRPYVKISVKPSLRVGLPKKDDSIFSFLRNVALRAQIEIFGFGKKLVSGEIELRYKHGEGVVLRFGLALVAW